MRTWVKGENPVPLPPDMFWAQMQQMKFTHREDSEKVFTLQAKVFLQKAASTTKLLIEDLDEDKIAVLAAALPVYTKLQELVVRGSQENAWKVALAVVESGLQRGDRVRECAGRRCDSCCGRPVQGEVQSLATATPQVRGRSVSWVGKPSSG